MRYWATIVAVSIISAEVFALGSADFARVINAPSQFDHKRVSLVGVAYVDGDRFTLYQDVAAARNTNLSHAISIQVPAGTQKYDRFHRWWIEVSGSVDAQRHGPHFGGFPCEMSVDEVRPLHRVKEKLWLTDLGEFRNKTAQPIRVKLSNASGGATFALGPGGSDAVDVRQGSILVQNAAGVPLFRSALDVPPRTNDPREPEDRVLQYSILPNRLEFVSSGEKQNKSPKGSRGSR